MENTEILTAFLDELKESCNKINYLKKTDILSVNKESVYFENIKKQYLLDEMKKHKSLKKAIVDFINISDNSPVDLRTIPTKKR